MLQLSTVDSNFFKLDASNLCSKAAPVTCETIRALKVVIYDAKDLYFAFLGFLGSVLLISLKPKISFLKNCL